MNNAAITIQRFARGFLARMYFQVLLLEEEAREKERLQLALQAMTEQVNHCIKAVDNTLDKAAVRIQSFVRGR